MSLRRSCTAILVLLIAFAVHGSAQAPSPATAAREAEPVNSHASPEARALLKYFYSISGHYALSGQHNYPNHISRWTDRVYDLTGKYPALFGEDFGFSGGEDKDSVEARPALIAEVERQYRMGAVVTLTWHEVRPTDDEPVTFRDSVQGHLTDFEWSELLTPGTELYNRWCAQVDVIAGFLTQLRDAHVPVLLRPYHEMNGGWFWWGGRPGPNGSAALYRQFFDRMVNHYKLNNLVWVWNVNSPPGYGGNIADYFPGAQYADLLTEDIYGEFQQSYYNDMLALAAGKPIALGEVGAVPSPELLKQQPDWTYFMSWSELVEASNPIDKLLATYNAPNVLTRGDTRLSEAMAAIRKLSAAPTPEPVTADASREAKALLARLYEVSGKGVLSGQENGTKSAAASTGLVFEVTAKYPAIYAQDLAPAAAPDGASPESIVAEAKHESQNHSIVSLMWHAPRPTDNKPTSAVDTAANALTDFEWEQLLTPGTRLYQKWCDQVDGVSAYLKQLQDAGIAVLWRPYPEPNGGRFWWSGRIGIRGSAALYQQIFDRMVNHNGLHNLIWVWTGAVPGFGPNGNRPLSDFFPGLLYVDALALDQETLNPRWRADTMLSEMGVGKVVGVTLVGKIPAPEMLAQQKWAWFLISPDDTGSPERTAALQALYKDPHVISRGESTTAAGTK